MHLSLNVCGEVETKMWEFNFAASEQEYDYSTTLLRDFSLQVFSLD